MKLDTGTLIFLKYSFYLERLLFTFFELVFAFVLVLVLTNIFRTFLITLLDSLTNPASAIAVHSVSAGGSSLNTYISASWQVKLFLSRALRFV